MIEYFLQYDGRILLLTLFGMVTVLPVGIVLSFRRRLRHLGHFLILIFLPFGLILGHEVWLHVKGERPWSPAYEIFLDSFVPSPKKVVFAETRFTTGHCEFGITHSRRGKYEIFLWTSKSLPWLTPANPSLWLKYKFVDQSGNVVFERPSSHSVKVWHQGRDGRGGSMAPCDIYQAPENVPLDMPLKCIIDFTGDIESFVENYADLRLAVEKNFAW